MRGPPPQSGGGNARPSSPSLRGARPASPGTIAGASSTGRAGTPTRTWRF
jgi:hypothetical protein